MEEGKILYAVYNDTCIIKMVGSVLYTLSLDFDAFIEKLSDHSDYHSIVIDLTETKYIDSTNLGLLARIYEFAKVHLGKTPTIISTQPLVNDILKNIGFYNLFTIVDTGFPGSGTLEEVTHTGNRSMLLSDVMLDAHKALVKINDVNAEAFKDVVKLLEDEKKAHNCRL